LISTALWEDPGFTLVESGYLNTSVISSDCPNGPKEILDNGNNGYIFKTNSLASFNVIFEKFLNEDTLEQNKKKIRLKKITKKFTIFSHFKILQKSLNEN
jgi:glycosyltransferase involved in cell wall biosynthesis